MYFCYFIAFCYFDFEFSYYKEDNFMFSLFCFFSLNTTCFFLSLVGCCGCCAVRTIDCFLCSEIYFISTFDFININVHGYYHSATADFHCFFVRWQEGFVAVFR